MGSYLLVHGSLLVFFGWFSLAVFGVSLHILGRLGELCKGYHAHPAMGICGRGEQNRGERPRRAKPRMIITSQIIPPLARTGVDNRCVLRIGKDIMFFTG